MAKMVTIAKDMEGDYEPFMNSLACICVWVGERERERESLARGKGKGVYCTYFSRNNFKVGGQGD